MSQIVTTRLPKESVQELESISKQEYVDRASLLRKMILEHIREYQIQKAAQGYQQGELSIEEAAQKAKVTIWQMIEYVTAKNIVPPPENLTEMERNLENTTKILKI